MHFLLLARHGNTFAPADKVVWVGAHDDLPLVESGLKQADTLAHALQENSVVPQAIYCGPLKRTRDYAQIINEQIKLKLEIKIDDRLQEIDYGQWSGLTDQEIKERFGSNEFDQWQNQGGWPNSFCDAEKEIVNQVFSFAEHIANNQAQYNLVVTSNGRLKYFLQLVPNLWKQFTNDNKWKVATGNLSLLSHKEGQWELISWNENPTAALLQLKKNIIAAVDNS